MPDEIQERNGEPEHPEVRYERADVNYRAVLMLLGMAVVLGAISFYAVWLFFIDYSRYQARIKESSFPLASTPSTALPPEPRLEQIDRLTGMKTPEAYAEEKADEAALMRYGRTREPGYIRIPIERAMSLLANKLPARAEPPASQKGRDNGLVAAGAANSGRVFRGKPRWYAP